MNKNLILYAYAAYKSGDYIKALQIYNIISKKIGEKNVDANIKLCKARLIQESNPDMGSPILKKVERRICNKFKALSILDTITETMLSSQLKLIRLDLNNYKEQIENSEYDFVFLESCWDGNDGMWKYAFTSPGLKHANAQKLTDAIALIKYTGKRIVFWNKEDPLHFERFLPIARLCDYILTTDYNCIAKYKQEVTHNNIGLMPFAVEPKICNPRNRFKSAAETVCFAGAYYPEKHDDRVQQMAYILPAILKYSGVIYDRYSNETSGKYKFPNKYADVIRPGVPFTSMQELYKKFKVFLNVNTITDSPTMMSRRVYEILGSGTPVVSSPSLAIQNVFSNIVFAASSINEVNIHIEKLLKDEFYWNKISHVGYREVMEKHTYAQRINVIYSAIGKSHFTVKSPLVSVIIASRREENVDRILENLMRQSYNNFEVILALTEYQKQNFDKLEKNLNSNKKISRVQLIEFEKNIPLGRCLNESIQSSHGEYIAKMDDDNFYFENYLSDMLIPFGFDDYDVVGKESYFCYLESMNKLILRFPEKRHCDTQFVAGDAMILKRRIFEKTSFGETRVGEDTILLKNISSFGGKIYSSDYFNFIKFRSSNFLKQTWMVEEEELLKKSRYISDGLNFDFVRC